MSSIEQAITALQYGGVVVYPLLLMGVVAVVIVIEKAYLHNLHGKPPVSLIELVETFGFSWKDMEERLKSAPGKNHFVRFFSAIVGSRGKPVWWVESRAADEALAIEKSMNRWLWILETIVTAAPLMGLIGTIVGMMDAFKLIGSNELVSPTGITAGVAQALIATALGLVIALIALFAFNYFSHLHTSVLDDMERLGSRVVDRIRMDEGERREEEYETA